jgi:hypothetical protein
MAERIRQFLEGLRLVPHERKFRIYRCAEGLTLLGWRILPEQMRLARSNVIRMRRRLKKMASLYHSGRLPFAEMERRVQAWLGHAAFGDTWRLRRNLFGQLILSAAEHGRNARGLVEFRCVRYAERGLIGLRLVSGSRFPPRRFRECQLRFRAVVPDAANGVK